MPDSTLLPTSPTMRLLLLGLLCATTSAVAGPDILFQVRTPPTGSHTLEATIEHGPHLATRSISVRADDDPGAPVIAATRVRSFAAGDEPIAIALVLNTQEIYVGNDDFETDPNALYPGVLRVLEPGLDALQLGTLTPAGSQITVIGYATDAKVIVPMTSLQTFKAAQIGPDHDYRGQIGNDMIDGIHLGLDELARSDAPHKLLIVIGDGNDTNDEAAKVELAQVARQVHTDRVDVLSVIYKSPVSSDSEVIRTAFPDAVTVNNRDAIAIALGTHLHRFTDRSYVTFADDRLPWDGREHSFVLRLGDYDVEPALVRMPEFRPRHTDPAWWRGTWGQLVIGLVLVGVLVAAARKLALGS